jgi:magnesium chelatase family protein
MQNRHLKKWCAIDPDSSALLERAIDKMGLSARALNRILKIGRTIADLAGQEEIACEHIAEAIQYRALDRSVAD